MAEQVRKQRPRANQRKEQKEVRGIAAAKSEAKKGDELKEELDALLDEIDEVLEVNAEQFVKDYVQKGGE